MDGKQTCGCRGQRRGTSGFSGLRGKFYILTVVVISPLYKFVKTHRTVHLKRVNVVECKLCLYNPDLIRRLQRAGHKARPSEGVWVHPGSSDSMQRAWRGKATGAETLPLGRAELGAVVGGGGQEGGNR